MLLLVMLFEAGELRYLWMVRREIYIETPGWLLLQNRQELWMLIDVFLMCLWELSPRRLFV